MIANLLKKELKKRNKLNSAYSLRAFAAHLKISPSLLSEVINGKKRLSEKNAERLLKILGYGKTIKSIQKDEAALEDISWLHLAILELCQTDAISSELELSKRFKISEQEATSAVRILKNYNLIETKNNLIQPIKDRLIFGNNTPSKKIRAFHKKAINASMKYLEETNFEDRDFSFSTLALSKNEANLIKKKIHEMTEEFSQLSTDSNVKKEIYCISTQFYKTTNNL